MRYPQPFVCSIRLNDTLTQKIIQFMTSQLKLIAFVVLVAFVGSVSANTPKEDPCKAEKRSVEIKTLLNQGDLIKVFDTKGRMVKLYQVEKDNEKVDVCDLGLTKGEYYISVKSEKEPINAGKVVIK